MEILSINKWARPHLQNHKLSFRRTDDAVKRIVESIRAYGSRIPLLVMRAGEILDQQFRTTVARSLEYTQVPVHGTPKPVEQLRRPILNHTGTGMLVYDPFLGSGSILIAAQQTARVYYGLAMDSAYDAIVLRWEKPSRGKAVREADGQIVSALWKQVKRSATEQAVNSGAA